MSGEYEAAQFMFLVLSIGMGIGGAIALLLGWVERYRRGDA